MQYSVKMPVVGFVEILIDADSEDAALEQAQKICEAYKIVVRPDEGTSAPESMGFTFTDDVVGSADYMEVEIEELEE